MRIRPLRVAHAYEVTPVVRHDHRGHFAELYRHDLLAEVVGHPLRLAQTNVSQSARGVVRGIHLADVPPGQAKYVTCVRGAVLDVVVDVRVGSPTFGEHDAVRLDDSGRGALYVAEGLGHGLCALTADATVLYLCSETYAPAREWAVNPLDPALRIEWPTGGPPVLSTKDAAAPTLAELRAANRLPHYDACLAHYASLASVHSASQ